MSPKMFDEGVTEKDEGNRIFKKVDGRVRLLKKMDRRVRILKRYPEGIRIMKKSAGRLNGRTSLSPDPKPHQMFWLL
jgi:hypothetical protein